MADSEKASLQSSGCGDPLLSAVKKLDIGGDEKDTLPDEKREKQHPVHGHGDPLLHAALDHEEKPLHVLPAKLHGDPLLDDVVKRSDGTKKVTIQETATVYKLPAESHFHGDPLLQDALKAKQKEGVHSEFPGQGGDPLLQDALQVPENDPPKPPPKQHMFKDIQAASELTPPAMIEFESAEFHFSYEAPPLPHAEIHQRAKSEDYTTARSRAPQQVLESAEFHFVGEPPARLTEHKRSRTVFF